MKISFVILTRNEENDIEKCLKSIKSLAGEILMIDEFSTDKTAEIAKKFGAKVLQNKNSEDFAAARNLAMEKAKNDWVFFVDADEEVKGTLEDVGDTEGNCYRIKRIDKMWGRELKHGENGLWNEIRLVKKHAGKWEGRVHEVFKPNNNPEQLINTYLNHYPHQSIAQFLAEINLYSEIRAQELCDAGTKSNVWQIIFYPLGKFVLDYFLLMGFLDGIQGFVVATMMSFHSFLVRSKLYLLNRDRKLAS
jgi:glycosyltransferase involved in cell wall biosynthesis